MGLRAALAGITVLTLVVVEADTAAAAAPESGPRTTTARDRLDPDTTLRALYTQDRELLWTGDAAAVSRRTAALRLLERERRLDPSVKDDVAALARGFEAAEGTSLVRADRALTKAWLGYLARRRGSNELVPVAEASRVQPLLERTELASELGIVALELAIVEALGGWRAVPARLEPLPEPPALEAAGIGPDIEPPRRRLVVDRTRLQRRLVQSLDLPAKYLATEAPAAVLSQAVRRFQKRHGLEPDGTVGNRTLAALGEPVGDQLARVRVNLARMGAQASRDSLRRYVEVNVPAFELRLVQDGAVVLRSRVIVGDDKTPTPIFDDVIRYIDLDPVWYVPPSIVNELIEREKRNPGYLERAGFVWQNRDAGRPRLVQRPGPENALGRFKFVFPNHHAVYLHDTAQRGLFGRADQALSHGCVRVERPAELALALLAEQGWDAARLEQALATRRTRRIELAEPVPVFLDYRTAELDPEGRLRLFADIYGHDRTASTNAAARSGDTSPASVRPPTIRRDTVGARLASRPSESTTTLD
jgi:hypothetical protein